VNGRRESTVYAEDLVVDNHAQREVVEHIRKIMPYIGIAILARTLGIEAVGLGDTPRLVVTADKVNSIRVSKLQTDKEGNSFDTEKTAVDVVSCTSTPVSNSCQTPFSQTKRPVLSNAARGLDN
jgi:hypothetical protein